MSESNHVIEDVKVEPHFDLERYMILSQTRRLDSETADLVAERWERWKPMLQAKAITAQGERYVVLWLDTPVEQEVNDLWESSPSKAFTCNGLAQSMLMAAIQDMAPQIAVSGCAPVPTPNLDLREALSELGLEWTESNTLSKQYAMLTRVPYKGGCETCFLRGECPNAKLPGKN